MNTNMSVGSSKLYMVNKDGSEREVRTMVAETIELKIDKDREFDCETLFKGFKEVVLSFSIESKKLAKAWQRLNKSFIKFHKKRIKLINLLNKKWIRKKKGNRYIYYKVK